MKAKGSQLEGSVQERIETLFYKLTKTERRFADYLLKHPQEPQYMSISELADASGVAEASISRFCRKLGLKGFNAFKLEMAKAWMAKELSERPAIQAAGTGDVHRLATDLAGAHIEAIQQTLEVVSPESFTQAAELLHACERVFCMGLGGSSVLAREACSLFQIVNPKFSFIGDPHLAVMQTAQLGERDLILYFSYSGATKELVSLFELARSRGVKTVLVTRFTSSPGADLATLSLQCGSKESALRSGSVAARVAQLMVIDLLYELYMQRLGDEGLKARARALEALSDKLL